MSLVHNGVTLFGDNTHSDILEDEYELPIEFGQYFALIGESNIVGQSKGRDLFCEVYASGYTTPALLASAITSLQNHVNTPLFGDLVHTFSSGSSVTYQFCRLDSVVKSNRGIRFEPVSQSYVADVAFRWRQLQ